MLTVIRLRAPLGWSRSLECCAKTITLRTKSLIKKTRTSILAAASAFQAWDVVEFRLPEAVQDTTTGVALVLEVEDDVVELERLVQQGDGLWTQDDSRNNGVFKISSQMILRVLEADYSQRMDADRKSNPHGEHAHDVWIIAEDLPATTYKGHADL